MTDHNYKLLLVDDDPMVLEALEICFEDDYHLVTASNGENALQLVREDDTIAVAVLDIKIPGKNGLETGREIAEIRPEIPIIFHTAHAGEYSENDIDVSQSPYGYVEKGAPVSRLIREVRNAMEAYLARVKAGERIRQAEIEYDMIGRSEPMRQMFGVMRKVAPQETKVMILGETGTGKELVARAIHRHSGRANKPLVIFNCNHKPPDLVESELFGHGKGAFTGAIADSMGLFEYADQGTIFLDEIGDLDITTQAKILRVLETGQFHTIGNYTELKRTDVRVMCATHHDLRAKVEKDEFREDLYYRLKGVVITLPPLRERRQDIPLLVKRFVEKCTVEQDRLPKHFAPDAMELLIGYDWPGNVRQLEDTVGSLVVLTDSHLITAEDVRRYLELDERVVPASTNGKSLSDRIHEFRRNCIIESLSESEGNIRAAARSLRVDPSNLRQWIKRYDLEVE